MTAQHPLETTSTRGRLDWRVLALSLGTLLMVTYVLCIAWGLLLPDIGSHQMLENLLPGFVWLTRRGFLIGLLESFVFGAYAGAVFAVLYNLFARLMSRRIAEGDVPRTDVVTRH